MPVLQTAFLLSARLLLAALFLVEGFGKIRGYDEVAQYMAANSVAPQLLPLVIATELCGGALIALGLLTRPVAFLMAGFTLLTALFFHRDWGDPDQQVHFLKNLAIAGGFLSLVASGGGSWSLDAMRRHLGRERSQAAAE
jgi:putative oxidoreductase